MLDLVSFVGVDEFTREQSLSKMGHLLSHLSNIHPCFAVELGFLYSESRSGKQKRYPTKQFINDYLYALQFSPFRRSIHLCGQEAIDKFLNHDEELHELCGMAHRVQLNMNMDKYQVEWLSEKIVDLSKFFTIIVQDNKSKIELVSAIEKLGPTNVHDKNIHYLYDGSGGFGRVISDFKPVHKYNYTGYAGGINPLNALDITKSIQYHNETDTKFYIDMESGIRTDDKFDVDKCIDIILNLFHHLNYRNNL